MRARLIRQDRGITLPARSALRVPQAPSVAAAPGTSRELWIAAHLPQLALEALRREPAGISAASKAQPAPLAIIELEGRAQYVIAVDEQAARAGVRPGMSLAAAMALAPHLVTQPRDVHREQALLERLAELARRFTPRVSLAPPDALLLEVKGSLQLFGGAASLYRSWRAACHSAGVRPWLALAPTALAALAGARAGKPFRVLNEARLIGALAVLPLAVLRWPPEVLERLAKAGVRCVGEALRLPRAGFARRFGVEQLQSLDRLTGRGADLHASFQAPERFQARRDCTYELTHHDSILGALAPLFVRLGKFLMVRQCAITELECRLQHRHASPTCCVLKLAAPAADPHSLRALLAERLALLTLPEPVRSCELVSGELAPGAYCSDSLWQPGEHGGRIRTESSDLIERLRARLGIEAVHGLSVHPTHRPESASHRMEPAMPTSRATTSRLAPARSASQAHGAAGLPPWPAFRRPMWLLPAPQLLRASAGVPQRHGPLHLLGEPERIESGWWEGEEVARDYYCAVDTRGARLWVFRERGAPHRWFLHGVFG
ncbi:MAG TPA: DNA polymerase Y family protein [Steroidobacteraceae bacterium]|nr:DNA polymerase Y family protein [Steroidobacteraceae bacterium]